MLVEHLFPIVEQIRKKSKVVQVPPQMQPYMNWLDRLKRKRGNTGGVIGSIVMNCNPFTLGHLHLVNEALKRCDYLYVFILDEDKSYFPFDERIVMAKKALAGSDRVCVIPSGKVILSSETMPEYFVKDQIQDVKIDTSYDLSIFAGIIAPYLGITKRFAGREPLCRITRQYNEGMRKILPRHGIEFIELERKAEGGNPISASLVRQYIKENNWVGVKKLAPPSTYDFLQERAYIAPSA